MKEAHHDKALIVIGKIGAPYGIHGWLKIRTYTEYGSSILKYQPWYLSSNNDSWEMVSLENSRILENKILAKFENINNPEQARLYTGKSIAILREQLPQLKRNEYYWSDLIGLTVINKQGEALGKVIYLMTTGSNDVLVVKKEKEHAIPYLFGDVILDVDLAKGEIHVDWELL